MSRSADTTHLEATSERARSYDLARRNAKSLGPLRLHIDGARTLEPRDESTNESRRTARPGDKNGRRCLAQRRPFGVSRLPKEKGQVFTILRSDDELRTLLMMVHQETVMRERVANHVRDRCKARVMLKLVDPLSRFSIHNDMQPNVSLLLGHGSFTQWQKHENAREDLGYPPECPSHPRILLFPCDSKSLRE